MSMINVYPPHTKPFNFYTLTGKLKVKLELYYKNIIVKNMKCKTNVITFLFR